MKRSLFLLLFFLIPIFSFGQIRLPKLVSDGMVLQRDCRVKIWGWASPGEKVSVHFINSDYNTTARDNGEWDILLPELKAGGPFEMTVSGTTSITIKDIVVGDVWICSGQSNMGSLRGFAANYADDIAQSENKFIRHFTVPSGFSVKEKSTDLRSGRWVSATPGDVLNFAAVGYFFAKKLYDTYKIPIGLINTSVGGSSAEAWISEESMKNYPRYWEDVQRFKVPGYIERINKLDNERGKEWRSQIRKNDEGYKNPQMNWFNPDVNTSDWETMRIPGYWADTKIGNINGVMWFRKEINVPASLTGKQGVLKLGRIADADSVYINGKFVGAVGSQYSQRSYRIPVNFLKEGSNTIVVRVINYIRHGGFVPGKQYEIDVDNEKISLEGDWKWHVGAIAEQLDDNLFTGKIPTGLYNTMLAPLMNLKIKGVVWYQGESNTSRAGEHYELFKLLIKDWRAGWNEGDFPFLFVQLPNFTEVNIETTKYDWALFRESQLKALAVPNTGMAVTVDIGEFNDIHPVNKKDVGYRLALAAQKTAYGDNKVVYSGPLYKSMTVKGKEVTLTFSSIGGGLISKDGKDLNCFEICGVDNNYVQAKARIADNKVVVWSDAVLNPVAVRYAWANNPEGINFYNKEGLPASPFRTSDLY